MTQELDFNTAISALNAISGVNAASASALAAKLSAAATPYDIAYNSSSGPDSDKTAWMATALAAYQAAAHMCRGCEAPPDPLGAPDYSDPSVILKRIAAAVGKAPSAEAAKLLQGHASNITALWAGVQSSFVIAPGNALPPPEYLAEALYPGSGPTRAGGPPSPNTIATPSVRSQELIVAALITSANDALAAFAFS